jgi:hypothetical protein
LRALILPPTLCPATWPYGSRSDFRELYAYRHLTCRLDGYLIGGGSGALIASIGYQLASITAGGPAPLIATALLVWTGAGTGSGYVIASYIAFCALVSIIATLLMPDHTNKDA